MKYLNYILLLLLFGCNKYEYPETKELNVTVTVPEEFVDQIAISGIDIQIRNKQTGREHLATTNDRGKVQFIIRGGFYDIMCQFSGKYSLGSGNSRMDTIFQFVGAINGARVLNTSSYVLDLKYNILQKDFIFKELYTSGSRTNEGKLYYRDSFIEIYNNTEKTLYADGLCIGVVHDIVTTRPTKYLDENGNLMDRIPCSSFVAIIPGNGNEHPVLPGESVLLASSAINHKDDPNANPNSIDLSHADWELYVDYYKNIDAPGIPNALMFQITRGSHFMSFNTKGQVCILFRIPEKNLEQVFSDQNNYFQHPYYSFSSFMVPQNWIIDGVDNLQNDDVVYKRLHSIIDLGFVQHKGMGEKVSIRRKILEIVNDRTIYKDTNNSSVDFESNVTPTPGIIGPLQ